MRSTKYGVAGLLLCLASGEAGSQVTKLGLNSQNVFPISGRATPANIIGQVRGVKCDATRSGPQLRWPAAPVTAGKTAYDFLVMFTDPSGSNDRYFYFLPGTETSFSYLLANPAKKSPAPAARKTYVGINVFKTTMRDGKHLFVPYNARGAMFRNINGALSCSGPLLLIP